MQDHEVSLAVDTADNIYAVWQGSFRLPFLSVSRDHGHSQDFEDPSRPWNLYVIVSVNALDADPRFTWTTANAPNDPVHRGGCGPGRCDAEDGGSMCDFLDIQVSPADGAFWGTASDTCVGECVGNPQASKLRPGQGIAIRQLKGPSLFANR